MILQILIILLTARGLALVLRRLGQPPVIGEMAAGFVLGPIVFGWLMPDWHLRLFAPDSLREVNGLGQLGLVLFMFLMGAELRVAGHLTAQAAGHAASRQWRDAAQLAGLSLLLPMMTGLALAPLLYPGMAPAGMTFWPFALFIGTALSVTALPVLARILKERNLVNTVPGQLALSAAAIGDVVAWLMLAVVLSVSTTTTSGWQSAINAALLALLCAFLFGALRPWLAGALQGRVAPVPLSTTAMLLIGALLCAWLTERLQVHAAFGAFIFGLCLPRDEHLREGLQRRLEPLVLLVLMPCFFAYAGLNTTSRAFAESGIAILLLILGVAIAGKILAGTLGARLARLPWRSSLMVGALMNTRGVVELVFLKVGLDAGVIGHEMFTVLFVTALITTLMTSPLLSWLMRGKTADNTLTAAMNAGDER